MLTGDRWAYNELESLSQNMLFALQTAGPWPTAQAWTERSEGLDMIGARWIEIAIGHVSPKARELAAMWRGYRIPMLKAHIKTFKNTLPLWGTAAGRFPEPVWFSAHWQVGFMATGLFYWGETETALDMCRAIKDNGSDNNGIPLAWYDIDHKFPPTPDVAGLSAFVVPAYCLAHQAAPTEGFDQLALKIVGGQDPDNDSRNFLEFLYMVKR
jgi:hypothetical protein